MTKDNDTVISARREAELESSVLRQENAEIKRDYQEAIKQRATDQENMQILEREL
jgi:hypothetical protein